MSAKVGTSLKFMGKSVVLLGFSYYAGQWIMHATNPETKAVGISPSKSTVDTLKEMETIEHKVILL